MSILPRFPVHRPFLLLALAVSASTPTSAADSFATKIAWQQAREPVAYRQFAQRYIAAFNSGEPGALQTLISPAYERADRLQPFLSMIKDDHGELTSMRFRYFDRLKQRTDKELLAVYHTEFANGAWMETRVGLDPQNLLKRLIITDTNYNEDLPLHHNETKLQLPFRPGEEWSVLWGGLSEELNYHVRSRSQKNALDLLVRHPNSHQTFDTNGQSNDDYYAFGQPILAPASGVVIKTITGVADNLPGETNPRHLTGNTVVIKTPNDEYVLLAHLKHGSIVVAAGDRVRPGQVVGECGNSGNSSEPHLHMQLMDGPEMREATGIQMRFSKLLVDGDARAADYAPIRGNRVARK